MLSYQRFGMLLYRISNQTMEEIGATNPKYQPLRVLWHLLVYPRLKTIPLAPIHLFTKPIVPSLYQESLTCKYVEIIYTSFLFSASFHQKHSFKDRVNIFDKVTWPQLISKFLIIGLTFLHPGCFCLQLMLHSLTKCLSCTCCNVIPEKIGSSL